MGQVPPPESYGQEQCTQECTKSVVIEDQWKEEQHKQTKKFKQKIN